MGWNLRDPAIGGLTALALLVGALRGDAQEISGPVYARGSGTQIEAPEVARWQALATELKRQRDERDGTIADLRALLEKALGELAKAQTERDTWKARADELGRRAK